MSHRDFIRKIKTENTAFEIFMITPDSIDEFKIPYLIAIPEQCNEKVKIILESNNFEKKNGKFVDYKTPEGKQMLIDDAINYLIGNGKHNAGRIDLADKLKAPIIIPILPSTENGVPYYQQLSAECLNIKDEQHEFYRIDEQVCRIIDDAKDFLDYRNINYEAKIFLNGYSSSGVFAQRFALLHPQYVDTILVGGAIGSIPVVSKSKRSKDLKYPLGTSDYQKLTETEFDEEAYKEIKFRYYVAELEDLNKTNRKIKNSKVRVPMHDMSYFDRSIDVDNGIIQRNMYGKNMWKRACNQIKEYKNNGYDIKTKLCELKTHRSGIISPKEFEKVYKQGCFSKDSTSILKYKKIKWSKLFKIGRQKLNLKKLKSIDRVFNFNKTDRYDEILNKLNIDNNNESLLNLCIDEAQKRNLNSKIMQYEGKYRYDNKELYRTKMIPIVTVKMAIDFFSSIDESLGNKVKMIFSGKTENDENQFIQLQMYKNTPYIKYYSTKYDVNEKGYQLYSDKACAHMPKQSEGINDLMIYVPLNGDISDLYRLFHEITHSFDTKNGDSDTRRVMGEILPQYFERLLDEFLINMSEDKKNEYGIKDENLKTDIIARRVSTFISRYKNAENVRNKKSDKETNIRYMLAQIYEQQLTKIRPKDRREKILQYIEAINNDDFELANKIIKLNIEDGNSLNRRLYISKTFDKFNQDTEKIEINSINKNNQNQKANITREENKNLINEESTYKDIEF